MRGSGSPQSTSSTYSVSASGCRSAFFMIPTLRSSSERSTGRVSAFFPLPPLSAFPGATPFVCWLAAGLLLLDFSPARIQSNNGGHQQHRRIVL